MLVGGLIIKTQQKWKIPRNFSENVEADTNSFQKTPTALERQRKLDIG